MKDINKMVAAYCAQLENREIRDAYEYLLKFTMRLKGLFLKREGKNFIFGNVSPGYMDYSYFPFYNAALKKLDLRFGIVLNHKTMAFELWLMGQNAKIQKDYWQIFKDSSWMKNYNAMPSYSVLEIQIIDGLDFNHENEAMEQILENAMPSINEVLKFLEGHTNTQST